MPSSSAPVRVVQFGVFEVDLRSGELRKSGTRVKLHDQPFQVLAMLLDRPGELVTREEIRQKLWPGDTFVDFDHGLNNAVNRVRDACDKWGKRQEARAVLNELVRMSALAIHHLKL